MKTRHSSKPIPRLFYLLCKDIVNEASLRPSTHSRLRAKLLVFKDRSSMHKFYAEFFEYKLRNTVRGVVNALSCKVTRYQKGVKEPIDQLLEVDPYYFCVICLCKGDLTMEVITHESVHAGFAYAARQKKNVWSRDDDLDEEEVCYPAGIIAAQINRFLYDEGLYSK